MNIGSLFSGVGGFSLAANWLGWATLFFCEKNKFLRERLKEKFPNAKIYERIETTCFKYWRGRINVLTGGDPCQPNSYAGLRKGKDDDRFLWPQMFRAIREIQPAWAVNENVDGSISNGVLDIKIDDLESEGYTCQAYSIPAEAVGAMHKRSRIWLIAYNPDRSNKYRTTRNIQGKGKEKGLQKRDDLQYPCEPVSLWPFDTYPDTERLQQQYAASRSEIFQEGLSRYFGFGDAPHGHIARDVLESGVIRSLNGLPEGMDYTERFRRISALGNTIVPQVAYEIFKAINAYE